MIQWLGHHVSDAGGRDLIPDRESSKCPVVKINLLGKKKKKAKINQSILSESWPQGLHNKKYFLFCYYV